MERKLEIYRNFSNRPRPNKYKDIFEICFGNKNWFVLTKKKNEKNNFYFVRRKVAHIEPGVNVIKLFFLHH
jgi:hypothetical protein